MRDQETAQIGMRAAMTGHLVLSTLHTNDAVSTPMRLLDMGVPRYMMGSSLQAVLAQRLVRVICPSCTTEHTPFSNEMEWLREEASNLPNRKYAKGQGCSHCSGTGYKGRIGVYELLEMTTAVVDATHQNDPSVFMAAAKKQMGGRTLRKYAIELAQAGITTVAEAMRISNQLED
jgi:MSHA biogenesis protein MshE